MANNYVESSFEVQLCSKEELRWWEEESQRFVPDGKFPDEMEHPVSNDWELDENDNRVWFHGDGEAIDVDSAASVLQRFLIACIPQGCISFTWAETCSKPRIGEFGGGACFITAQNIKWLSTYEWINSETNQHKKSTN